MFGLEAHRQLMEIAKPMALCSQKRNPGFLRSCRKLNFCSFTVVLKDLVEWKWGSFLISAVCVHWAARGNRVAWGAVTPCIIHPVPQGRGRGPFVST
jgi:hypothetical protein